MRIDLHVHSKFSRRPSQWVLQKFGCPESFTEPSVLHRIALEKGMTHVTITDHNSIEGCLEIAHLPNVFISEEVTTYFPEGGCKVHVLVYDIDEAIHSEIQDLRRDIFELAAYLHEKGIHHVLAHPLFSINDRLTVDHFEQFLLLFKNFEINGSRDLSQNRCLEEVLGRLRPEDMERLAEKHRMNPLHDEPWIKHLTGGSDDHSALNIARHFTEVPDAVDIQGFFLGIRQGRGKVRGEGSTPRTLAHNLYGIAYQFYKNRFQIGRHVNKDPFLQFIDRFLDPDSQEHNGLLKRFYWFWNSRRTRRFEPAKGKRLQDLLRYETRRLISDDPAFVDAFRNGNGAGKGNGKVKPGHVEETWFHFVNKVSNKALLHFGNHLLDHLSGGQLFNIFQTIGSAGSLYSLLAPYFVSFSVFTKDRCFCDALVKRFSDGEAQGESGRKPVRVGHFTDTFYEVNGVALTLQHQVRMALKTGKNLTVITCDAEMREKREGIRNFKPIGVYELPEYPEQKLFYPPFLEMLDYCFQMDFTHIHSATPGPIGLAALAIARILKLPITGTYHTALPQYAWHLTGDSGIQDLVWKYTLWYYEQMDFVYVPSRSTGQELLDRGIKPEKIRIFPRGIDVERFHPSKRDLPFLADRTGLPKGPKILYVGRISKEKNLQLLGNVCRRLLRTHPEVGFVFVGDGPYHEEFQEMMRGTPSHFTGYVEGEELAKIYASCDLFVFPSTTDTFGNVVLEAQASGIPVVVSNCGGPRENMIPGKTGVVVKGDDAESLLAAIEHLLESPERLREMGGAARKYMEDRSFEEAFDRTWKMYRDNSLSLPIQMDRAV